MTNKREYVFLVRYISCASVKSKAVLWNVQIKKNPAFHLKTLFGSIAFLLFNPSKLQCIQGIFFCCFLDPPFSALAILNASSHFIPAQSHSLLCNSHYKPLGQCLFFLAFSCKFILQDFFSLQNTVLINSLSNSADDIIFL